MFVSAAAVAVFVVVVIAAAAAVVAVVTVVVADAAVAVVFVGDGAEMIDVRTTPPLSTFRRTCMCWCEVRH
jgi:hypothetical protein